MTERIQVPHPSGGRRLVKRAEKDGTDINAIVRRARAGQAPAQATSEPRYGDFTGSVDYHVALSAVRAAEANFMELDPRVRRHCNNDPGQFLDMVMDPERRPELVELGLVEEQLPLIKDKEPAKEPATPPADQPKEGTK